MMLQSFASNYTHLLNQISIHTNEDRKCRPSQKKFINVCELELLRPELLAFMTLSVYPNYCLCA